jgi:hypothetical protein
MGAVAVAVVGPVAVVDGGVAVAHPAGELLVAGADARIDHVRVDALAGLVVRVRTVQRQIALVEPVEPPGGGALRGIGLDDLVGLDVGDPRVGGECGGLRRRQLDSEALEGVLVDGGDRAAMRAGEILGDDRDEGAVRRGLCIGAGGIGVQDDDVGAADGLFWFVTACACARGRDDGENRAHRGGDGAEHLFLLAI